MSGRTILVIGLALVCGLAAAVGIVRLRPEAVVTEAAPEVTKVVVAKAVIPRGATLTQEKLEVRPWPTEYVPAGVFLETDACLDRMVHSTIVEGDLVSEAKLVSKEAGRGLAALVPMGMRAYTIQTPRVASSVAGFILPGNYVDVLLTLRGIHTDETGGGSTVTLLQAVEILAVDQQLDAPKDNKVDPDENQSVTLLVTPDQVTALDLGQNLGLLTLSLRNPADRAEAETTPATINLLRYMQKEPVTEPVAVIDEVDTDPQPAVEPPRRREPEHLTIETLRGTQEGRVYVSSRRKGTWER